MKQLRINTIISVLVVLTLINYTAAAYEFPNISAQSYVVIDATSGRILASANPEKKLPIASTTKILTTILAIESIENLEQKIEVPASTAYIEGSTIYLKPGQFVSVKDLLYGTMLRSGNDAATTLALYAGSLKKDDFVAMMNKKAKELGAINSNFVNPSGLHDDNHYSTAYDLALISMYAMKNETFREISSTQNYKTNSMFGSFYNKNKVVQQYENGTGIKIGYTKAAGRCLVASAKKDQTEVIAVLLNDNNWFNDSYDIFDWALEKYQSFSIVEKDQYVTHTLDNEPVFISDSFSCILSEEEKDKIKFEYQLKPPIVSSQISETIYGSYSIYLDDELLHTGSLKGK